MDDKVAVGAAWIEDIRGEKCLVTKCPCGHEAKQPMPDDFAEDNTHDFSDYCSNCKKTEIFLYKHGI